MTDNTIKGEYDMKIWMKVFEDMEPKMRRWAFIAAKMAERGQSFNQIAKKHRMTAWLLGAQAHGKRNMSAQAVKALEQDLGIDLGPFLEPREAIKCGKKIVAEAPVKEEEV